MTSKKRVDPEFDTLIQIQPDNTFLIKDNGVTYRLQLKDSPYGECVCTGMKVEPGIHSVTFYGRFIAMLSNTESNDKIIKKQYFISSYDLTFELAPYADVTEIEIYENVENINIMNHTFPNVRNITSFNQEFPAGMTLRKVVGKNEYTLLNSFCLKPNEILDLTGCISIKPYALAGCNTVNIANTEWLDNRYLQDYIFEGSAIANNFDTITHISMIGDMVVSIDSDADNIIFPKNAANIYPSCLDYAAFERTKKGKEKFHSIKIQNEEILFKLLGAYLSCENLIIDSDTFSEKHIGRLHVIECDNIIISDDNPIFSSFDGILYDKEMKRIIKCPESKEGKMKIANGVTQIDTVAFADSKITELEFPDSLLSLEEECFVRCKNLQKITFGHGIMEIKESVFAECTSLESVIFPEQLKFIDAYAFYGCLQLSHVEFNKDLYSIAESAFDNCPALKNVEIPSEELHISEKNFDSIEEIFAKNKNIAKVIMRSVITDYSEDIFADDWNAFILNINGQKIALPKYASDIQKIDIAYALGMFCEETKDSKEIQCLFDCGRTDEVKEDTAVQAYLLSSANKNAKEYITQHEETMIERYIQGNHDDIILQLVKADVFSDKTLSKILEWSTKTDRSVITAYTLQALASRDDKKSLFAV